MRTQSADPRLWLQRALRTRTAHRGQVLILAVIIILLFIFTATALIDVYHLEEARNWGYQVAQDAAMAGASFSTTRWEFIQPTIDPLVDTPTPRPDGCMNSVAIELNRDEAISAATEMLTHEMSLRGFSYPGGYEYDIRALPDVDGGTIANFPPVPVRLGGSGGNWSASHPAVGVYLSFHVSTFMMSLVGRSTVDVHVFAAAEVTPPMECP